jgi:hypothetical protein
MNANERKKVDHGAPPRLIDMIEAADRKIHDYFLHQHLSHWHPISTATYQPRP